MTPFPRDRATGRMRLSTDFEVDLSEFPIDEPIPPHLIPEKANFHQSYFAQIAEMARCGMTPRQMYMNYERGLTTVRGTPMQIADRMQDMDGSG
jgi:hypothetical protein